MLSLADVVVALSVRSLVPEDGATASSTLLKRVVVDSRQVVPDSLFVALRGQHSDGHEFIGQAVANGATVVIAERLPEASVCHAIEVEKASPVGSYFVPPVCLIVRNSLEALQRVAGYWRRKHDLRVVGVTGSVGKTTSKELIAAVLSQRYCTLKSEGNYNNEIGLPLTLVRLDSHHQRAVLEMGMYGLGEIARLAEIALPQVGVVTNIGPTHLERLGTIERIAQAKAELLRALPPAEKGGVAILNADDERVRAMGGLTSARKLTYGLSPEADLWADAIESKGLQGTAFQMHSGQEVVQCQFPILGSHGVLTALCAAAVGIVEGLSWKEIVAGLSDPQAQLRLIAVPGPQGATLLDDTYNASPASCIAALNLLGELEGRRVAILGGMLELGSFEAEGHRLVGRRARDVADLLVTVGPLARIIGEEALAAGMPQAAVTMVETNAQAAEFLLTRVQPGDVVLVKGSRGMRMEEIVASLAQATAPIPAQAKER